MAERAVIMRIRCVCRTVLGDFARQITFARGLPNLTWYDQFNNALMTDTQC